MVRVLTHHLSSPFWYMGTRTEAKDGWNPYIYPTAKAMINEIIEQVYYAGEMRYAEHLTIATTIGNFYHIDLNGYHAVSKEDVIDHSIDQENELSGLTILKEAHDNQVVFIELFDQRFIEYYLCSGFIDFLEGREYKTEYEYNIISADDYEEYKQIIDDEDMRETLAADLGN